MSEMTTTTARPAIYSWPDEGVCRVPYWVYLDQGVYEREMEKIFRGSTWNYVALEAEIPNAGDFKTTWVGDTHVIVSRDTDGSINAMVNKCAHRGTTVCREEHGNAKDFTCIYHQWNYDLKGNLQGVPFRRGVLEEGKRVGGMPTEFNQAEHRMRPLKVEGVNGVVFVSFDPDMIPFRQYLGEEVWYYYERVFDGRPLRFLGRTRQKMACNWKLVFENIKDPYHATLLHVFLVTFGLFRADQKSKVVMDETGMHGILASRKGEQKASEGTVDIASLKVDYHLHDPSLLNRRHEFKDENTVVMQTLFPNLIVQQQTNTLAARHIIPRGPGHVELLWDFFGYETDDDEMLQMRLKQANLMGPSGFVSIDDAEAMEMCQRGLELAGQECAVMEMGGRDAVGADHMVTESAIRGFYEYYRLIIGID
jgi:salicylate 5-hydroxylase large subunit